MLPSLMTNTREHPKQKKEKKKEELKYQRTLEIGPKCQLTRIYIEINSSDWDYSTSGRTAEPLWRSWNAPDQAE